MSKRFRVAIVAIMLVVVLAAAAVAIGATSSSQNTAAMHVGCVLSPSQQAVAKQLVDSGRSLTPQQIDALCK